MPSIILGGSVKDTKDVVIYIAGSISGDPNYKRKFRKAEKHLREMGFDKVINPICVTDNLPYECYAPISIGFVQACDCLFVLRDWKESKGARAEVAYAEMLGKEIFYEENILNLEIKGE